MKLLALDTATELCSAALWIDEAVATREAWAPRAHGQLILPMVQQLLADAQLKGTALDAIAFGRGPGAFTGVRLAAAVAQGLGFAWGVPLIPISDLLALAAAALPAAMAGRVLVCQDARMQEVYWACFERATGDPSGLERRGLEAVSPVASVLLPEEWMRSSGLGADADAGRGTGAGERTGEGGVRAVGSGFGAYPDLLRRLQPLLAEVLPDARPHARDIAGLAAAAGLGAALAPEFAEPVYVRDRVTSSP